MLEDFKKPDVKAPRYRAQTTSLMSLKLYKKFLDKFPEHKHHSFEQFKRNIDMFNEAIWKMAIEHRDGIELPESLGNIFIGTCWKTKRRNINFGKSCKYGKAVTNHNYETDGKIGKIFYTNYQNKYRFPNRVFWMFRGIREFKRMVAQVYPTQWKRYIHVDPDLMINKLYKKRKAREYMQKQTAALSEFYNEFEID